MENENYPDHFPLIKGEYNLLKENGLVFFDSKDNANYFFKLSRLDTANLACA